MTNPTETDTPPLLDALHEAITAYADADLVADPDDLDNEAANAAWEAIEALRVLVFTATDIDIDIEARALQAQRELDEEAS